jgi:hypothetical protein
MRSFLLSGEVIIRGEDRLIDWLIPYTKIVLIVNALCLTFNPDLS